MIRIVVMVPCDVSHAQCALFSRREFWTCMGVDNDCPTHCSFCNSHSSKQTHLYSFSEDKQFSIQKTEILDILETVGLIEILLGRVTA
jgi:MoaA/NifB/PqqE/SkfB family radical SAM enzyme